MEYRDINILFVLVLYKCKVQESNTFLTLTDSLKNYKYKSDFLIYDNSPEFNVGDKFDEYNNCSIIYQADKENNGVSKAYNIGAKLATKRDKKWVLLLDQDTNFPIQTINQYLSAIEKYPEEKLFAPIIMVNNKKIISPCYFKFMRGFYASHIETGLNTFKNLSLINSGMCIDINAFEKNGGYNEQLKLDFSDHEFIKRFKKSVTNKFIVIDLKVYHNLSTETKNSFNNDKIRFNYYLNIGNHLSNNFTESIFIKFNLLMRVLKLSIIHKSFYFILQLFSHKDYKQNC